VADNDSVELDAREKRNASPDRLLAFTDGVYAIIITILVLEIAVPELGPGQTLRGAVAALRPTFVAFVISFLIVGTSWVGHRSTFSQVRYIDINLLWLNLLYLLPVALIPFATATLGEHGSDPLALRLYGVVLIAATLMRLITGWYLDRHPGLLWQAASRQTERLARLVAAAPLVVYTIAMIVAGVSSTLSLVLYFSMPILYFGLVLFLKTDPRTRVASEDLS
jgi:TMEM175 potassium channel family protein